MEIISCHDDFSNPFYIGEDGEELEALLCAFDSSFYEKENSKAIEKTQAEWQVYVDEMEC